MHNVSEQNNIHTIIRLHTSYTTHVKREQALHAMHASERGWKFDLTTLSLSRARVRARTVCTVYIYTYILTYKYTYKQTYICILIPPDLPLCLYR